jgi:dipeptidyl-peptidase-4
MIEYDVTTGLEIREHFVEQDAQWVEPEAGPIFLPDGSGHYLWFSFASGYRQLHRYAGNGAHLGQVTSGKFDFMGFVDWVGNSFLVTGTGINPLEKHLFLVDLVGAQRQVTAGRGQHDTLLSPNGERVLDTHTNLELPLAIDLLTTSGQRIRRVHEAENPLANYRLGTQRVFTTTCASGEPMYGHLILPPDLDATRKYPILQYVYGGPHSQLVQDRWLGGQGRWVLWLHMMATRGFVVFRADNRGTANRGIEWQQAIHRRLGTLEVEDQVKALDHILQNPWADSERVGIHGWSYGGFMTLSLMTRAGERYRAGIAGAPVTNWAFYETGYGERYMDTPAENPEGYSNANPSAHVKGLRGRLLVVHGTADETVMWQSSIDFLSHCIEAGVEVETMVYPGQLHGLTGRSFSHFLRKMTRFFDDCLLPHRRPVAENPTRDQGR